MATKKVIVRNRSAISGRFVKPGYAKQYPKVTIKDRMPASAKNKKN